MSSWLNAVTEVLDGAVNPKRIFFRDDDAGWSNEALYLLLDEFAHAGIPIDVAVIPKALDRNLADDLLSRYRYGKHLIGLHQHGFSHANHEPEGRKCEFGSARSKIQQKTNIEKGHSLLHEALGDALDPFFTPPWNRCTQATVECLEALDFKLLSRDASATCLDSSILHQVPIHIDWSRIIKNSPDPLVELGLSTATHLENNALTGIMLHHADMSNGHLKPLATLLKLFADHANAHVILLRDTLG